MNLLENKTILGVVIGVVMAFSVICGGWSGPLWVLLFASIGGVIGAQLDGKLDIAELISTISGKGRSS
ncbi:DUF2273 domain-containing protein [Corynebacterium cystitidis]|uniref:Small integral membrane protein n=1 Tax=Corynebacterium cystitidis DSM 20524 TaxID=1121357 RepID=A0A1H9R832_9CORY|nr:DUF2273 domain-containing protein [Corynebacterium cystitidis]WJY81525.1 hypothetical protein CCYS_02780 [Corynebacterium cystitidis DSM 20524]SER68695.1 Small integral membrane protein [Corynebacterium cystitidis DSM 20524]SNV86631.1 Uncharacterised protein [Corynebacterium cystitidis]